MMPGTGPRRERDGAGTLDPMPPSTRFVRRARPRSTGALLVLLAVAMAACGGSKIPLATFDPTSSCTTDGRQPGAYPDLESLLPTSYEGKAPGNVDSGRSCTAGALGTLAAAGISQVRFAGATWSLGGSTALTVAVFEATGLDPTAMIGFYDAGARADSHTEKLQVSDATVGGQPAKRLDVLASNGTGQTIVVWPAAAAGRVHVLLASDLGDAKVVAALELFGTP